MRPRSGESQSRRTHAFPRTVNTVEVAMPAHRSNPDELQSGYVTTLRSITRRTPHQVADALGLHPSALTFGYIVYALVEPVRVEDFEWKDQTAYSDGWHFDPTIGEYVQRADELRASLGKRHRNDEATVDARLRALMATHVTRLNVREGPERIVKVAARQASFVLPDSFPDAPLRGVPQWRLRTRKKFVRLAEIAPGQMVL